MRSVTTQSLGVLAGLLLLVGGCASSGGGAEARSPQHAPVSPALVIGPGWSVPTAADGSWEASRQDEDLGMGVRRRLVTQQWVEVRSIDRRWTSNGRVREHSSTITRTLERGRPVSQ